MDDTAHNAAQIRDAAMRRIYEEGLPVAVATLIEIAADRSAPKNPRVAAARSLVEISGLNGVEGLSLDKPLSEMTRAELSAAKDRALAYLADLERPVIEGRAIEVQDAETVGAPPAGDLFD